MKERILAMLAAGKTYSQIVSEIGCAKSTISYYAKSLKEPPRYKMHDWTEVQRFYDAGHSGRQSMAHFRICRNVWYNAKAQGKIVLREAAPISLGELTAEGRNTGRAHLRWRILKAGIFKDECAECGLTEWNSKPLSLHLHHINGVRNDNRIENLQMLCPNCHSQTKNYSGRNNKKQRINKYQ